MNTLEYYINQIKKNEIVTIIDNAVNTIFSPMLRSLPFLKIAGLNKFTCQKTVGDVFSPYPIENCKWIKSKNLLNQDEGGYGIFTNQYSENIWTCKPLIIKKKDSLMKGIVIVIPDNKFRLNQGMRPFIEENIMIPNNVFYYSSLINDLVKEVFKIFNTYIPQQITPHFLEAFVYSICIDNVYPTDLIQLINHLKKPKNYYLDYKVRTLLFENNKLNDEDIINSFYYQLGTNEKLISELFRSLKNYKTKKPITESTDIFNNNLKKSLLKIRDSPLLTLFLKRNMGEFDEF